MVEECRAEVDGLLNWPCPVGWMWGSAGGNWLRIGVVPAGEDVMDRYLEGRRARLMSDGVSVQGTFGG